MKQYPFLDLALANRPLEDELKEAACRVIASGRYLHGEETDLLEKEVAATCETEYCIAVSNGLDALKLILRAYKELGYLADGDKVIVPANTFIASVLSISDNHLIPVFCDPAEDTMNMDSKLLERTYRPKSKGDYARASLWHSLLGRTTQTDSKR